MRVVLTSILLLLLTRPYVETLTLSMATTGTMRSVAKVIQGRKMQEGAGVQICRTIGTGNVRVDPYLMLDELKLPSKDGKAGFPWHPHRGFETCSILLSGRIRHEDSAGNKGVIGPGGVQWMTAGRGIIHSEMPESTGDELLHGFQLWINLPAKHKMVKPRYQDYQADSIPVADLPGGTSVRVMAGEVGGSVGPIKLRNPGTLLDVRIPSNGTFTHALPPAWNGFAYVYQGSGSFCGSPAAVEQALLLGPGDHVSATAGPTADGLRLLLVAGQPIGEPIVQHGPFVMNTQEEIAQAFSDYQSGKLQDPSDNVWVDDEL